MEEIVFYLVLLVVAGIISSISNKNKQEREKEALRQQQQSAAKKPASRGPVFAEPVPKKSSPIAGAMLCPRCSFPNPSEEIFCTYCGQRLKVSSEPSKKTVSTQTSSTIGQSENIAHTAETNIEKQEKLKQHKQHTESSRRPFVTERKQRELARYTPPKKIIPTKLRVGAETRSGVRQYSKAALEIKQMMLDNPDNLKHAFLIKEILDKPLALRRR